MKYQLRLIDAVNARIFGVDAGGMVPVWNCIAVDLSGFIAEKTLGQDPVNEFINSDQWKRDGELRTHTGHAGREKFQRAAEHHASPGRSW